MIKFDISKENVIRTITLLNRKDYEFLNSPEFRQKKNLKFYLEWCCGLQISNVRFKWCIERNYDKHGKDCQNSFEICLTETELTQPDPWRRITFFDWNNDDFADKKYGNKLYICEDINYQI